MARATRRPGSQARQLGLLIAAAACAAIQDPPGGPPDATPPAIVSTRPDSGAIVPGWHDPVVIQFNEVIDERSGGSLERLVTLSPVPEKLAVDWKRTAIAVRPKDGWRDSVVYQLTLLPGVQDLRNNRQPAGRTIVFSTGGEIPATRIAGTVVDWEQGRIAPRGLIEAIRLPDSLRYVAVADSAGGFAIGALPRGRYLVRGGIDANNNRRLDPREPLDSVTVQLDSSLTRTFWAFRHDTLGPSLSRVAVSDSVTLRVELNQALPPEPPAPGAVTVLALPDSTPVAIAKVWLSTQYDSLTEAERGQQQGAKADTTRGRQGADTSRVARLLRERPKLTNVLIVQLAAPVTPGGRYVVVTDLPNLIGARGSSRQMVALPPRAAPPRP